MQIVFRLKTQFIIVFNINILIKIKIHLLNGLKDVKESVQNAKMVINQIQTHKNVKKLTFFGMTMSYVYNLHQSNNLHQRNNRLMLVNIKIKTLIIMVSLKKSDFKF